MLILIVTICFIFSSCSIPREDVIPAPTLDEKDCVSLTELEFERDLCYLQESHDALSAWDSPKAQESCLLISDPHLQYLCLRLPYRPHMLNLYSTMTMAEDRSPFDCHGKEDHSLLFCLHQAAAKHAERNLESTEYLCRKYSSAPQRNSCLFGASTSLIPDLKGQTKDAINRFMEFCDDFDQPQWKSECYFLLADEIAFLNRTEFLREIVEACKKSSAAHDFQCPGHIVWNLPPEIGQRYCGLYGAEHKVECVAGLGVSIGKKYYQAPGQGVQWCNNVSPDYQPTCYESFSFTVGKLYRDDTSQGNEKCKEIPGYEGSCLSGIWRAIARQSSGEVSDWKGLCAMAEGQGIGGCFNGALFVTDKLLYTRSLQEVISACESFPSIFRTRCFNRVIYIATLNTQDNIPDAMEMCGLFPKKFHKFCLLNLGWSLGETSVLEIDPGKDPCAREQASLLNNCIGSWAESFPDEDLSHREELCGQFSYMYQTSCGDLFHSQSDPDGLRAFIEQIDYTRDVGQDRCFYFPENFSEVCFEGMGGNIAHHYYGEPDLARQRCMNLPQGMHEGCLRGMSKAFQVMNGSFIDSGEDS